MLAIVTDFLRNLRLLGPGDEPRFNLTIVTPRILNIGAFARDGGQFHVRVKETGVLPNEYENYCDAWRAFPDHVPEPLGRQRYDAWDVFVVRGIRHRAVMPGSLGIDRHGLVQDVVRFFVASGHGARVNSAEVSHREFLRGVQERATDPMCVAIVGEWLATDWPETLPHIRQHGDFVLNNLGLTDAGITVFDWEDFGRITFPGMDLCTILASDASYVVETLRSIANPGAPQGDSYSRLLDGACPEIGLSTDLFRKLIPLYLVLFLDLKNDPLNYGVAIGRMVSTAIHGIRGSAGRGL